jgi:hypothetical protein
LSQQELHACLLEQLQSEAQSLESEIGEPDPEYPLFLNCINAKNQNEINAATLDVLLHLHSQGSLSETDLSIENLELVVEKVKEFINKVIQNNPIAYSKILENYQSETPSPFSKDFINGLLDSITEEIREFDSPKDYCIAKIQNIFSDISGFLGEDRIRFENKYAPGAYMHEEEITAASFQVCYKSANNEIKVATYPLPV